MSVLEPRPKPGSVGPVGLLSESCPWGGGSGNWLMPPWYSMVFWGHQETLCSGKQHTELLLMAVADCSPGGHHGALSVPFTWSCMYHTPSLKDHPLHAMPYTPSLTHLPHTPPTQHPTHTISFTPTHHPTHPACPQHTQWLSLPALWCFSSPLPAHPEYIKTPCSDPDRLSVTAHTQAGARVTCAIMGCDMVWCYQHRHLQGILVLAQTNSKLCTLPGQ